MVCLGLFVCVGCCVKSRFDACVCLGCLKFLDLCDYFVRVYFTRVLLITLWVWLRLLGVVLKLSVLFGNIMMML